MMQNKKIKTSALFTAVLLIVMTVFAIFNIGAKDNQMNSVKSYIVENIDQMRSLVINDTDASIVVKGYYTAGDGGGGTFYWDKNSASEENGGTIFKNANDEIGRYIRLCDNENLNLKWFGAKGDGEHDDTLAFQNALKALPDPGGSVSVPNGTYNVSETIIIGNGNMGSQASTKKGIHILGDGNANIRAVEKMNNVIEVKGMMYDLLLSDLTIDCNKNTQTGVRMTAFIGCAIRNSNIVNFTKKGLVIMGGGDPCGNYNTYNQFENLNVRSDIDGAVGVYFDGDFKAINDTWLTTMTNCSFVATGYNSIGAHCKFVDSISLYQCTFTGTKHGVLFDAIGNSGYPSGIGFYDCSVSSVGVLESASETVRKQWFLGFKTDNGEVIPNDYRFFGITDQGKPFYMEIVY